ncbi:ligase-associated DNA damage response endonuclease PdeM [Albibacterium bauzanense]|uniref:Putative phosphoesterase n=1 Tax=Albibacterium bauzanense TaxID=653929 RepID=A0A4R1LVY0_9SPHI|nr:ligase-associated DNA damage response endonuclease PdeM [Albibacterium bauzanense]TCK83596.1 putative phosphoesterase [Albibacterium bauzanense]
MTISIRGTEIQLLSQKAIYLVQYKILVIADMHLGKLLHFRKKGIFAPSISINEDLETMQSLIEEYKPDEVVFLGDLFHSELNSDSDYFLKKIALFPHIRFTLTKGNHDIIPEEFFNNAQIDIIQERILEDKITLRHQLPVNLEPDSFYIIGHVHPGYVVQRKARQTFRLPCFYQSGNVFILPAFGRFTGLFIPEFSEEGINYVIINNEVIHIAK